ncbi:MAG: metallophosphoesterase [Paludibacteraceae bacterium]|nr:metallophosphoesterase [Paludibacteraceae bacterium]
MKNLLPVLLLLSLTVSAKTIMLSPGANALYNAVGSASDGDTLVLAEGTYAESNSIKPAVPLCILAADGAKPVVSLASRLEVKADITIKGVDFRANSSSECVRMVPGASPYDVTISGCSFSDFSSRTLRVYNTDQTAPYIGSLKIDDCLFSLPSSGRGLEAQKAEVQLADVAITNSTFTGGAAGCGRMIYLLSSENTTIQSCIVDHCTFYNSVDTRAVYLGNINGAQVTNSILMNRENIEANKGFCLYGKMSAISHSVCHKASVYGSGYTASYVSSMNPLFVNADGGDYRFYANSPATGSASDGGDMGDPRWQSVDEEYFDPDAPYVPYKKPYSMSPTTNSVKILWQMDSETKPTEAVVHYGTSKQNLNMKVATADGWNVEGEGYVHVVTLTGLEPFTRYYFTVGDSVRRFSDTCYTKTAPLPGTAYRIFSISDIHGDACNNWSRQQDFICGLEPDIALMNGDFVSDNGADRRWNGYYFTPGAQFLATCPVMSSVGNHETGVPGNYRWSSFYDYFHQFSHGASTDPYKDPRGEAYFHFQYGNADVIMLNLNGDASSPDFLPGSEQYRWADSVLNACTLPWIIVCHHVGIYTTGYHGQWSEEPKQVAPLLEKYAAKGKRIISLSGDDHSFEHLYKDGVHYVRPGCGRDANYTQQKQLVDYKYSMFYRKVSCFSTLDMAADASHILLTAYDSVGNKFYTYDFLHEGEVITPAVNFTNAETSAEDSLCLRWCRFDPAGGSRVSLYYTSNPSVTDTKQMTVIAEGIEVGTDKYVWHTRNIEPKGTYYVYAAITSAGKTYLSASPLVINLLEDTTPPPAPTGMTGRAEDGHYTVFWKNPTHLQHLVSTLQDFSQDMQNIETDEETGSTMSVSVQDGAIKADYSISEPWKTSSLDYVFAEPTDISKTMILTFRMKGDGSSTPLRLVLKNLSAGHEDWWYTEQITLSSTQWKEYFVDLSKLQAFTWYTNSDNLNHGEGAKRISFSISTGNAASGTFFLDDICLSGDIVPAPDFLETVVLRKDDSFSESPTDGKEVYRGKAESFTDMEASADNVYYYSAFATDDRGNYSLSDASAQWCTTTPFTGIDNLPEALTSVKKIFQDGQLLILFNGRRYTSLGQDIQSK